MFTQSERVVAFNIENLLANAWKLVADHNLHKMVPTNVQKMNVYTFQSLAQINSTYLQAQDGVDSINDHTNLGVDNLLGSFIKIEKKHRSATQTSQMINNNSAISTITKFKVNKPKSLASKQPSKISSQRNKNQTFAFKQLETTQDQIQNYFHPFDKKNKDQDFVRKIQILRDRLLLSQQMRKKQQQEIKKRQLAQMERDDVLKKKQKQLDKFTYDYNGDFFGSKNQNPQNTLGSAAKVKSQFPKQNPKNLKNVMQKIKPRFTTIVNEKLEQRHKRLATQELENTKNMDMFKESLATRFANSFSNDQDISEGISIKQTGSNFSRIKPFYRVGQKLTLSEFKKEVSNKKFKQFRAKPIKSIETHVKLFKNKLVSHKSQENFLENQYKGHTETSQKNQKNKNQRYHKMFRSEQSSILSNSRVSKDNFGKGSIKVDNLSLYRTVLNDDQSIRM